MQTVEMFGGAGALGGYYFIFATIEKSSVVGLLKSSHNGYKWEAKLS